MKKLIFLLFLTVFSGYSQEKWRELSLNVVNGINLNGHTFTQVSANLSYELGKKYSLSSWNGFNYNYSTNQSWISSQTTVDKRLNKFVTGVGMQYGLGQFAQPLDFVNNTYFVVKVQYKIKL